MASVTSKFHKIITDNIGFIFTKVYNDEHEDGSRRLKIELPFEITEEQLDIITNKATEEFGDVLERVELKTKQRQFYYPEEIVNVHQILVYLKK